MRITFFTGLFTLCVFTCKAQSFQKPGFFDKNLGSSVKTIAGNPIIEKSNLVDENGLLQKKLFLTDTTDYKYLAFGAKLPNIFTFNQGTKSTFDDSLLIDNFSKTKLQKIPQLGFFKRNLLFKDTDEPVKLIN